MENLVRLLNIARLDGVYTPLPFGTAPCSVTIEDGMHARPGHVAYLVPVRIGDGIHLQFHPIGIVQADTSGLKFIAWGEITSSDRLAYKLESEIILYMDDLDHTGDVTIHRLL